VEDNIQLHKCLYNAAIFANLLISLSFELFGLQNTKLVRVKVRVRVT
jgi:hypothetical protein